MNRIFLWLAVLSAGLVISQASQAKTVFSSAYTDLSKDCLWDADDKDLQEGQDSSLTCRGVGGYQIVIYFSAMFNHMNIKSVNANKDNPEYVWQIDIPITNFEKGKVEWRLANGKPFAIIARAFTRSAEMGENPPQELSVKGLKGFEHIRGSIDVKQRDANLRARELADKAYRSQ
jgi:hypothetical protein